MRKRSTMQTVSRWILAFICSLVLFALLALGVLKMTLFNQEFMIRATKESQYAATITTEINTRIADLGRGSNFSGDIFEEVVPQSLIQENIDSYIRGIYTDVPFSVDGKEQIEKKLDEEIQTYADEKGYDLTEENTKQAVQTFKDAAVSSFDQFIEIPYILTYGRKVMAYSNTLTLFMILCGALFLILFIGVIYLTSRWRHQIFRYIAYTLGGSGLMLLTLPAIIYFSRTIDRLGITSQSMYQFLTTYLNDFVLTFIKWGGVVIGIAIICWFISEGMRKKVARSKN